MQLTLETATEYARDLLRQDGSDATITSAKYTTEDGQTVVVVHLAYPGHDWAGTMNVWQVEGGELYGEY